MTEHATAKAPDLAGTRVLLAPDGSLHDPWRHPEICGDPGCSVCAMGKVGYATAAALGGWREAQVMRSVGTN